jgi:hypothetical protein
MSARCSAFSNRNAMSFVGYHAGRIGEPLVECRLIPIQLSPFHAFGVMGNSRPRPRHDRTRRAAAGLPSPNRVRGSPCHFAKQLLAPLAVACAASACQWRSYAAVAPWLAAFRPAPCWSR